MATSHDCRRYRRRRTHDLALVWLLGVCVLGGSSSAYGLENLPDELGHAAILYRLAARGLIPLDSVASTPLPRNYARALMKTAAPGLTPIENAHLQAYTRYVDMDGADAVARYQGDGFALSMDVYGRADWQRRAGLGTSASAVSIRPVAYGGTSAFRFFTQLEWGVVSNASAYSFPPGTFPLRQRSITGSMDQLNMVQGHIAFGAGPMVAQIGKIPVRWGMASSGSLLMSGATDAKDGVRLMVRPGPFTFESLTAAMPQPGVEKYISAHRLGLRVTDQLAVGVHEAVVYTGLRPNYMNPFNVYLLSVPIVERQTRGDSRDEFPGGNTFFGADAVWRVRPGTLLYADAVLDDFQPQKGLAGFRDWDSKFAAQAGAYVTDPFGLRDADARAEYTFVNQYAYTHEFDALRYTLGEVPLGFFTGPDADDVYVEAGRWLTRHVRVGLTARQTRKGEQAITEPHVAGGPAEWRALSGVAETRRAVAMRLTVTRVARWQATARAEYARLSNADNVSGAGRDGVSVAVRGSFRM